MDFVKRFNLTPHVEGGAFRELYRDGERAKEQTRAWCDLL